LLYIYIFFFVVFVRTGRSACWNRWLRRQQYADSSV